MPSKLKSFALQGYKTFASRTEFQFADRVTAIIGPNGSGKSNIADALRWVLGEQSYSLLRGKKTEDMIFSGSETRSRAGMASATILFDNSDGWLPIDFTEVAITRRAYRDGQNEYLLNGQRVRLRDVSELLAQSGLAERTYTVIGQGLVDAALSLKADERRRLFEEAAGIGLYRSRKDESLRRLEATHRNIERVQDILAELQPRLRSLERQAKRANEFDRLKADLHIYLLDWYGFHWHQAQGELARIKLDVRSREEQLTQARIKQQELDKKIIGFRDRIQKLRDLLADKNDELSKYHAQKELIIREIAVSNERLRSLKVNQEAIHLELSRSEEESLFLNEQSNDVEMEKELLITELANAKIQYEECKQTLDDLQNQQSLIEERIEELKNKLTGLLTQKADFNAHASRIIELDSHKDEIFREITQKIDELQREQKELEEEKNKVSKSIDDAISARKQNERKLTDLKNQIKVIINEREVVRKNISSSTVEFSRAQTQLEVIEQTENTYQGYNEGAKLLLDSLKGNKLPGGQGSLSNYLIVPASLEIAIASALGEYIDAFLVNDRLGVEHALDLLENKAVRGILLPMASLHPEVPLYVEQIKMKLSAGDFIGIASDLVEAPESISNVVDFLLGQVIIVKDRSVVNKIIDTLPYPESLNLRVVTLNGEIFHVRGPVMTGSSGQTVLSRPRRKREIDQELVVLKGQLDEFNRLISKLDEQLTSLNAEEKLLENVVAESIALENRLSQDLFKVETDIERNERNLNWQITQLEKMNDEISQRGVDLQDIQKKVSDIEKSIMDMKQEIQTKEISLHNIPIGEQQAQFTFWNSRVAVIERGLSDHKSRISDLSLAKERSSERINSINGRIAQISIELQEEEIREANLKQEEHSLTAQISELQELIKPSEAEVRSLEQDLLNLQKNDMVTRQGLSTAEHNFAQSRIAFSQTQEKLERLRNRIEDDFGLVEYQYAEDISGPTPLPLEGFVEKLPVLQDLPIGIDEIIQRLRSQMHRIGPINPEAKNEFTQISERLIFLNDQLKDLQKAETDIREVIVELDSLMDREFRNIFEQVAQEFKQIFTLLFGGGGARLELTEPGDINATGIEIIARLPGRREQGLSLLSGGERSLTASALIFALLKVSPPPFCVLDEVDAMLDEANVGRFSDMLKDMSKQTQFIVVTHNRGTIQTADVLYGVTMGRDSSSQVISLKLEDITDEFGV